MNEKEEWFYSLWSGNCSQFSVSYLYIVFHMWNYLCCHVSYSTKLKPLENKAQYDLYSDCMSIQRIIIPRFIKRKQSHKTVYIKKQWSANRQENCHTLVCFFFFFFYGKERVYKHSLKSTILSILHL